MFVPLHDDAPLQVIRFQYVTGALIVINAIVFLMTGAFASEQQLATLASGYGVIPAELTHALAPIPGLNPIPEPLTLITYQFLHAGWMHVISNMLFLWVFADNIEDAFGHAAFLFFYLISGIAGALSSAEPRAKIGATAGPSRAAMNARVRSRRRFAGSAMSRASCTHGASSCPPMSLSRATLTHFF